MCIKKRTTVILTLLLVLCCYTAMAADSIEFPNAPVFDSGYVTVSWTDSKNMGPYSLGYFCLDSSDMNQGFWACGDRNSSTTSSTSLTMMSLLPGRDYLVVIYDKNDDYASTVVSVPAPETFQDEKLKASAVKVSLGLRSGDRSTGKVKKMKQFSASEMNQQMGNQSFGLYYELRLPKLSHARDYLVQLSIVAPNGYVVTLHSEQYTFSTAAGFTHYINFIGGDFFQKLYDVLGGVPTGEYTVETFFNGMLANTQTFRVN